MSVPNACRAQIRNNIGPALLSSHLSPKPEVRRILYWVYKPACGDTNRQPNTPGASEKNENYVRISSRVRTYWRTTVRTEAWIQGRDTYFRPKIWTTERVPTSERAPLGQSCTRLLEKKHRASIPAVAAEVRAGKLYGTMYQDPDSCDIAGALRRANCAISCKLH